MKGFKVGEQLEKRDGKKGTETCFLPSFLTLCRRSPLLRLVFVQAYREVTEKELTPVTSVSLIQKAA